MADPLASTESVLLRTADAKIRAAIAEGQFDNLPGLGKPSPLIDEPYDPGWWIRRKLKREDLPIRLIPD